MVRSLRDRTPESGHGVTGPRNGATILNAGALRGLAIDNALNFLNTPDGIQGHNFATQVAHVEERRVLQGRLTLVRYNNEPQFFVADASVFYALIADLLERLGAHSDDDVVDSETLGRIKDAIAQIERRRLARERT